MTLVSEARTAVGPLDPLSREVTIIELPKPATDLATACSSLRARAKLRITNLHLEVCFGPWSLGWFGDAEGRRLMRAPSRALRGEGRVQSPTPAGSGNR